jgi:hypothetical protein
MGIRQRFGRRHGNATVSAWQKTEVVAKVRVALRDPRAQARGWVCTSRAALRMMLAWKLNLGTNEASVQESGSRLPPLSIRLLEPDCLHCRIAGAAHRVRHHNGRLG